MNTEGAIESVHTNGLSVLSRLNLEEKICEGLLSPNTKQTVPNNKVSVLSGSV